MVEAGSNEPLADVRVELRPPRTSRAVYLKTDEEGRVRLDGVCEGPMRITATESHHATASRVLILGATSNATTLELTALHDYHTERVITVHTSGPSTAATSEDISGAALARTRGDSLAKAVSGVAGVTTLGGTAGGMAKPVIRGQVGRRNLIIFDGIRHEGQKWGIDHAPEIDPYSAGRITVVKGAATTRFGPDAIGGVVLLDPRPLPRAPATDGEVMMVGRSNALGGGTAVRLDHAPTWAPGFALRAEGNVSRHRAALTPDYPLDNTGELTWNAGGRLGYLSGPFDVVAGYRVLSTKAGICTCLRVSTPDEFAHSIAGSHPAGVEAYSPEFAIERAYQAIQHHLAMARTRIELGRAGELHVTYAYQYNDRDEYDVARKSIEGPQLSFLLGTHTGELRYEHAAVAVGKHWRWLGTLGGHGNLQVNDFDAAVTLIPDYRQVGAGAFAIERLVHDRVEFEAGGRYETLQRTAYLRQGDYDWQSSSGRLDDLECIENATGGATCDQFFHTPSATVGVLTRPLRHVPEFDWRLELDSSARIPAIDEHYMNGAAPSFPLLGVGDARLGIERTWGGATSLRFHGAWLHTDASAYANYVDDYIYFRPEPQEGDCAPLTCTAQGEFPVFAFSPTDAAFVGGELHVDLLAPRLPFEVSGNASWVRAFDLDHGGPVTLMPADRYELAGRYLWPDSKQTSQGFFEVNGTVVDRQRNYDVDADFAPPPPAFVLLGAALGVEFPMDDTRLVRVGLEGENLLNARYREYTSLLRYFADEPGWSVRLRVGVEFDVPTSP